MSSSGESPALLVGQDFATIGYQQLSVDHFEVEIGVGSPTPVYVVVSGNLPDTCSQVEYTEVKQNGSDFNITLSAIPSKDENCIQDTLPFKISVPLNVVNLPKGTYEVNVIGATASFDPYENNNESDNSSDCTNPVEVPISNGKVSFDKISFILDPALADAVSAQSCPAVSLSENQSPGGAHPPYTIFLFPNHVRGNTDFQPEIHIYNVTGNMKEYPFPY